MMNEVVFAMTAARHNDAEHVTIGVDDVFDLALAVLHKAGLSTDQANPVAKVIKAAERDECYSHGLYRLPGCVETIRSPGFVPDAVPDIVETSPAVVHADAAYGYSLLAFERALCLVERKAKSAGVCILAINNCFHFSALWPEIEEITERGLAAIAMTPSHSWVAPAGGTRPVLGTNPIAFGWPRGKAKKPYVFDFATSAIARSDLALHKLAGKPIPAGWGMDKDGNSTIDPAAALSGAMLPFGNHKGSALSTMIELLAGPLIGDMTSMQSMEFDGGVKAAPCHGELIIAFDPKILGGGSAANHESAEALFAAFTGQGARLPSQRRYAARKRSMRDGVRVPNGLYERIRTLR